MTAFLTLADYRASLQRQHDAYGPMIEDLQIERRVAAARLEVLDQVEAIQAAQTPFAKIEAGLQDALAYAGGDETRATVHIGGPTCPQHPYQTTQDRDGRNRWCSEPGCGWESDAAPTAPPRQRQDVRGPVLALLRDNPGEWQLSDIDKKLAQLKAGSIRAALRSLLASGEINCDPAGLYWFDEEQPSRDDREERRAPVGGDPPTLAVPSEPVARDYCATEPADPRTLTDTSPESQAKALRAAVEGAGPAGLSEDNACVEPLVIAAGIEAGWLNRGDGRLWIAEQEAAQ